MWMAFLHAQRRTGLETFVKTGDNDRPNERIRNWCWIPFHWNRLYLLWEVNQDMEEGIDQIDANQKVVLLDHIAN